MDLHTAHGRNALEPLELAHAIVDLTTQIMASDVLLLDISALTIIADYFVIVTGDSDRQLKAIADHTVEQLRDEHGLRPLTVEGIPGLRLASRRLWIRRTARLRAATTRALSP